MKPSTDDERGIHMEQLAGVYAARRKAVLDVMGANSLMVLYSGESVPAM